MLQKEFQEALERIWRSEEVKDFSYLLQRHVFGIQVSSVHYIITSTLTCKRFSLLFF